MTRYKIALIAGTIFLGSCGAFVPPRVACQKRQVSTEIKVTAANARCPIPGEIFVTVTSAPRTEAAVDRNGTADEYSLAHAPLMVKSGNRAVFLCEGITCTPNQSQLDTVFDENGAITYTAMIISEELGIDPGPGGDVTWEGVLAVEEYSPGNACPVDISIKSTCEEPTGTE